MARRSKTPKQAKGRVPKKARRATKPRSKLQQTQSLAALSPALNNARQLWMNKQSVRRAARNSGVSASSLRRLIEKFKLGRWDPARRAWRLTDLVKRELAIISDGDEILIRVRGFNPASLAMQHRAAVHAFWDSNDIALLTPFEGLTVTDTSKKRHVLETRPNVLLRLANAGGDAEMKIYRLI